LHRVHSVAQNGAPTRIPPQLRTKEDVMQIDTKADFVAAWRAAAPPADYEGHTFDAQVLPLGVLAPVSSIITHQLFGGICGGPWLGKTFMKRGSQTGINRFASGEKVRFGAHVAASRFDQQPALVLDYRVGDSAIWGTLLGMRDELREVAPGVLIGLGSMAASGGMQNSAPFVMWKVSR
jgi:hypothetical protein